MNNEIEQAHKEEIKEMKHMFESMMRDMYSKHQETMNELKQEMRDLKEKISSENFSERESPVAQNRLEYQMEFQPKRIRSARGVIGHLNVIPEHGSDTDNEISPPIHEENNNNQNFINNDRENSASPQLEIRKAT